MLAGANFILCSDILNNAQLKCLNVLYSEMNREFINPLKTKRICFI
jgi:hypothetical protein